MAELKVGRGLCKRTVQTRLERVTGRLAARSLERSHVYGVERGANTDSDEIRRARPSIAARVSMLFFKPCAALLRDLDAVLYSIKRSDNMIQYTSAVSTCVGMNTWSVYSILALGVLDEAGVARANALVLYHLRSFCPRDGHDSHVTIPTCRVLRDAVHLPY